MSLFYAILKTCLRAVGAFFVSVAVAFLAMFLGVLGGGGAQLIQIASVVILFAIAWSLLPLARASRILAGILAVAWLFLGVGFALSAYNHLATPWLIASSILIIYLVIRGTINMPSVDQVSQSKEQEVDKLR
ncbi:hypothetical protein QWZ03_14190 [Chitinimonas viridis]|uniref:Uncharacterized protein n=1 Tax=Chitinimonas viridis TaxID=664880 RepID=A0ABT8B8M4_9NEIS|nr:hypothetical protein [Chitinimonas viridis]MDN3577918.1 hypothetical protein [Chitinimonas viridis]